MNSDALPEVSGPASSPESSPLPLEVLDKTVENARWLQEQGLLRPTRRPPLLRIHPKR